MSNTIRPRFTKTCAILAAVLAVAACAQTPAPAAPAAPQPGALTASRGEMLFENHCLGCHDSLAYVKGDPRARSADEVEFWVRRRAAENHVDWTDEDIGDVTGYLLRHYYRFDQPPQQ